MSKCQEVHSLIYILVLGVLAHASTHSSSDSAFRYISCLLGHPLPEMKRENISIAQITDSLKDFDLWHWHGHSVGDETCLTALPVPRQNPSSSSLYRCWQSLCRALVLGRHEDSRAKTCLMRMIYLIPTTTTCSLLPCWCSTDINWWSSCSCLGVFFLGKGGWFPVFWGLSLLVFVCLFWSLFLTICIYLCISLSRSLCLSVLSPSVAFSTPSSCCIYLTYHASA